ncbi:unnamed protein product [Candida verbasci]|uniref:Endonuclease/exonuclease/phosphatase domain-containing protein n=1 Tax=Candida verbasci TaxID=1227364 RepID=A0A9W4TYX6_9ASCO|nr:unnamed protein product [Candida verbasci]
MNYSKQQSRVLILICCLIIVIYITVHNSSIKILNSADKDRLFHEYKSLIDSEISISTSTSLLPEATKNPSHFLGEIKEIAYFETSEFKGIPEHIDEINLEEPELPKLPKVQLSPLKFRIYSHNIKNGGNHELVVGEDEWRIRMIPLVNSIKFHLKQNTIITLQEVYYNQLIDIMKLLGDEFDWYGHGRISEDIGELVPIIYKKSEWEPVYKDSFWLNEKDQRKNLQGWDALYLRIVSYITLKHIGTSNYINIFNTHWDHIGIESKLGSANLILEKISKFKWPSFLTGDLNTEREEEPYKLLKTVLVDTATTKNRYGHSKSTVTGFEGEVLLAGQNIDYIFAPKEVHIEMFGLLHSKFNGKYFSDHRPLVSDFNIQIGGL